MQTAAALGQLIAPGPKTQGPAKERPAKKTSEPTERPSVGEDFDAAIPQTPQESSASKTGSSFADRLKDKLKEQGPEKNGSDPSEAAAKKSSRQTPAAVTPFPTEIPQALPKTPKAAAVTQAAMTPRAKSAAVINTDASGKKTPAHSPAFIRKSDEKAPGHAGQTNPSASNSRFKSLESEHTVKAANTEKTSPELPAEAKPQGVKPSPVAAQPQKPVASTDNSVPADPSAVKVKTDGIRMDTPAKPHPEQLAHPAPPAFSQSRSHQAQGKEPSQEDALSESEKKPKGLSLKTSQKPEQPEGSAVGKEPGRPTALHADLSAPPVRSATRDIGVPQNIKPELNVTETKEIANPSTGSVFTLHTPSQQILKHLPDAAALAPRQIRITLSPAELGTVRISFQRDNQEISGLIEAQRPEVRREIEQAMPQIISTLQQQGLQVRRVDIQPMPDVSANRDTSGTFSDPSMQKEFAHSGYDSDRGNAFSGYSSEGPAEGQDRHFASADSKRNVFSGSGLNLYI